MDTGAHPPHNLTWKRVQAHISIHATLKARGVGMNMKIQRNGICPVKNDAKQQKI